MAVLEYNAPLLHKDVVYFIQGRSHAYRLPRTVDGKPKHLWQQSIPKDRYYASPAIVEGLIYAITRGRHLTVLNAADGKKIYSRPLELGNGNAFASITSAGKYIFIGIEDGTTAVLEPGQTYREVARNVLEPCRSTPVFQGRRMYVRGLDHLYCIEAN
jgi:outer membrane protein assembly factor BamB